MRVFVTGAAGALGRHLVPGLVAAGHEVTATTRTSGKAGLLREAGAEPVVLDGLDREAVIAAVRVAAPEVIVHEMTALAGIRSLRNPDKLFAATNALRTRGTDNLLVAAAEAGTRRLIAQSYAGPGPDNRPRGGLKTEDDPAEWRPIRSAVRGPAAIRHLREGADWSNVIVPQTNVLADIAAGNLAQVTWVIPNGEQSDHALSTDGTGPSWVASIVNAIGNSPYWADTAIILTWDDWGGWYDHVAPSIQNAYEYGFRVPLVVISPYAKSAYVSHVTHDFGSILHFIEATFGLPSLGYADARADDLSDCFDFIQMPISWVNVSAQVSAAQLVAQARSRPQTDPDDD